MTVKHDQHMMVDMQAVKRVVEAAAIGPYETVLEIGAGSGILTRELARHEAKVIAVEIDKSFEKELRDISNTEVVIGNILELIDELSFDCVVANIPYAICEPLMKKLQGRDFRIAVMTVPKKFSETLIRGENIPGMTARVFFDMEVVAEISRESFMPAPKTDSVVMIVRPKKGNELKKEVLKRRGLKVRNAIIRGLFAARKATKNQAKEDINTMKINNNLLEKRLSDASAEELDTVLHALEQLDDRPL